MGLVNVRYSNAVLNNILTYMFHPSPILPFTRGALESPTHLSISSCTCSLQEGPKPDVHYFNTSPITLEAASSTDCQPVDNISASRNTSGEGQQVSSL